MIKGCCLLALALMEPMNRITNAFPALLSVPLALTRCICACFALLEERIQTSAFVQMGIFRIIRLVPVMPARVDVQPVLVM